MPTRDRSRPRVPRNGGGARSPSRPPPPRAPAAGVPPPRAPAARRRVAASYGSEDRRKLNRPARRKEWSQQYQADRGQRRTAN